MDGKLLPHTLWLVHKEKPIVLQRFFGRAIQATNSKLTSASYQQVSGVHQARQTKSEVCKGATEKLP